MSNYMSTVTVAVAVVALGLNFYVIWNVAHLLYQTSEHDLSKSVLPTAAAKPTAQNVLLPPAASKDEAGMIPLQLNIFERDPLKDHALNVVVTLKGFRIIVPGNYLVWVNIEYAADKLCSQFDVQTWTLNLMVNRKTGSTETSFNTWIVESKDYICENENVPVRDTVHLKKIIKLMAFDVVYVSVTQAAPVTNKNSSNYAGLHLIN